MPSQVLAIKWRPQNFASMVGQAHVLRALSNALDQQRLHHAYLFSGTRGVGKTTLARILAKCLNCEQGTSSKPCGTCNTCKEIEQGRFLDLLEIDAASRTKVEDTRELLENVQYAPTSGRYKIYLIDEVHMLSVHSFNALLKTLEEPPEHVKFLLATTDPQRLPITVLSRCLQFNLKCLTPELITQQLAHILQQENIQFTSEALGPIAQAAKGSMRDALSLLDQAIAFAGANAEHALSASAIRDMLGTLEPAHTLALLDTLAARNSTDLLKQCQNLAEHAADFDAVLEDLLSSLHQIALQQAVGEVGLNHQYDLGKIAAFAQHFSQEDIQLFYQIGLIGRRDIALAPNLKIGFEMIMLRMLAFYPAAAQTTLPPTPQASKSTIRKSEASVPKSSSAPAREKAARDPAAKPIEASRQQNQIDQPQAWETILPQLQLSGITKLLANHCQLQSMDEHRIELQLDPTQAALLHEKAQQRLQQALNQYYNKAMKLSIQVADAPLDTLARQQQQVQQQKQQAALAELEKDSNIQALQETFNAKLVVESVKPLTHEEP